MLDAARRGAGLLALAAVLSGPAWAEQVPRLTGIVVAGSDRLAIFHDPEARVPVTVREGERIGGYNVFLITARTVGLESAAGRRLIQPGADPIIRIDLAADFAPAPLTDPYRRERETQNDQ